MVFWPSPLGGGWGDKWWACSFVDETETNVKLIYSGHFNEGDQDECDFDPAGKFDTVLSKLNILKKWEIKFIRK